MERLTKINSTIDKPYVEINDCQMSFRKTPVYDTNCYTGNAITKLAEFEDFMEELGFESLEEFKRALDFMRGMNVFGVKKFAENQALNDRWENFKKWIANTKALRGSATYFLQETLLEKMQEFEKGE